MRVFTSHCDAGHSFPETQDGTVEVVVAGDFLPRHVLHRGHAMCAYVRMLYVAVYVAVTQPTPTAVFMDSISIPVPLMRLIAPVLFYCHFPDKLLCVDRSSFLKRLYRYPLDWLEERTTAQSDLILVNSHFTSSVFQSSFRTIHSLPHVLYPPLNLDKFDASPSPEQVDFSSCLLLSESISPLSEDWVYDKTARYATVGLPKTFFLSINRFERKKNIELALAAFAAFVFGEGEGEGEGVVGGGKREEGQGAFLVLAGGYDTRVDENVEYLRSLNAMAHRLGLQARVLFLLSFSDEQKIALLRLALCVLYTPSNEHFGIVPVEAMYSSTPVIAVNSGGPTESIVDGETGFLCAPKPDAFRKAMDALFLNPNLRAEMGKRGRERVVAHFSLGAFQRNLLLYIRNISNGRERMPATSSPLLMVCYLLLAIVSIGFAFYFMRS